MTEGSRDLGIDGLLDLVQSNQTSGGLHNPIYSAIAKKKKGTCSRMTIIDISHPALKRQDRLGKEPFAGFGTVVEDITESGYTKNQPILLGPF